MGVHQRPIAASGPASAAASWPQTPAPQNQIHWPWPLWPQILRAAGEPFTPPAGLSQTAESSPQSPAQPTEGSTSSAACQQLGDYLQLACILPNAALQAGNCALSAAVDDGLGRPAVGSSILLYQVCPFRSCTTAGDMPSQTVPVPSASILLHCILQRALLPSKCLASESVTCISLAAHDEHLPACLSRLHVLSSSAACRWTLMQVPSHLQRQTQLTRAPRSSCKSAWMQPASCP